MADNNNAEHTVDRLRTYKVELEQSLEAMINDELRLFAVATGVQVKRIQVNLAYKNGERMPWVAAELDI